jgi:hypothetical protein
LEELRAHVMEACAVSYALVEIAGTLPADVSGKNERVTALAGVCMRAVDRALVLIDSVP